MRSRARQLLVGGTGMTLLVIGGWWASTIIEFSTPLVSDARHQHPENSPRSAAALSSDLSAPAATPASSDEISGSDSKNQVNVAVKRLMWLRKEIERSNTTLLTVSRTGDRLGAIGVVTAPTADQVTSLRAAAQRELEQLPHDHPDLTLLQERLSHLMGDGFTFEGAKKLVLANYNYKDDTTGFGEFFGTDESGITYGEGHKIEIKAPEARYTQRGERYDYLLRDAVEAEAAQRVEDAYRAQ